MESLFTRRKQAAFIALPAFTMMLQNAALSPHEMPSKKEFEYVHACLLAQMPLFHVSCQVKQRQWRRCVQFTVNAGIWYTPFCFDEKIENTMGRMKA